MILPRANTEHLVQMLTAAGAEVTARFFDAGHALTKSELSTSKRWLER
jgi:predicted esterase